MIGLKFFEEIAGEFEGRDVNKYLFFREMEWGGWIESIELS